ncbi:MAG: cytochrome C [Acidobacteria bacterium]|nr:MAG: cytochrome C [Acidobacteriota bacterium]
MNRSLTLLMLFCILLLAACKVSQPGDVESSIMKSVKRTVTIGDKEKKNPIASSPDAIKEGGEHFQHHCQICHGLDGHATGVPFAAQMSPPVPDLSDKDIQEYTDGQLHWIVENGIAPSGMPAWKGILDDDEMWKVVHYIRNLPAKGSLGAPAIFKEEAEEHEKMEKGSTPEKEHHQHKH